MANTLQRGKVQGIGAANLHARCVPLPSWLARPRVVGLGAATLRHIGRTRSPVVDCRARSGSCRDSTGRSPCWWTAPLLHSPRRARATRRATQDARSAREWTRLPPRHSDVFRDFIRLAVSERLALDRLRTANSGRSALRFIAVIVRSANAHRLTSPHSQMTQFGLQCLSRTAPRTFHDVPR